LDPTGAIANDGSVNASFEKHQAGEVFRDWYVYDSTSSQVAGNLVKDFGHPYTLSASVLVGAILDKDRALFVEALQSQEASQCHLWLKEGTVKTDLSFMTPQPVGLAEMSYTPNLRMDGQKRLWITTGTAVFLEKREGGSDEERWHEPTSMGEGVIRLNEKGVAITPGDTSATPPILPKLWRNGKYHRLNEVASKPAGVNIIEAIDLASNGIILVRATENGVTKTGLLIPVEVRGYATEEVDDFVNDVNHPEAPTVTEKMRITLADSPDDPDDTEDTDFKTEFKSTLKIAQLGGDNLFTSDPAGNCTFVHGSFKQDLDIFRVRLPDFPLPAGSTEHRIKIWTTHINGITIVDPGAEVDLNIFRTDPADPTSPIKFHETAALALVADTDVEATDEVTDDKFKVEGKEDDKLGDRTYRAKLGGLVKIKWLTVPGEPEFEIPIIAGRVVNVTGFIMPGGAEETKAKATKWFKRAKEIYAAIGVDLVCTFKELDSVPDGVDLTDGFNIPTETAIEHLSVMQPETIALMAPFPCSSSLH